jgi:hypothetical protein
MMHNGGVGDSSVFCSISIGGNIRAIGSTGGNIGGNIASA